MDAVCGHRASIHPFIRPSIRLSILWGRNLAHPSPARFCMVSGLKGRKHVQEDHSSLAGNHTHNATDNHRAVVLQLSGRTIMLRHSSCFLFLRCCKTLPRTPQRFMVIIADSRCQYEWYQTCIFLKIVRSSPQTVKDCVISLTCSDRYLEFTEDKAHIFQHRMQTVMRCRIWVLITYCIRQIAEVQKFKKKKKVISCQSFVVWEIWLHSVSCFSFCKGPTLCEIQLSSVF